MIQRIQRQGDTLRHAVPLGLLGPEESRGIANVLISPPASADGACSSRATERLFVGGIDCLAAHDPSAFRRVAPPVDLPVARTCCPVAVGLRLCACARRSRRPLRLVQSRRRTAWPRRSTADNAHWPPHCLWSRPVALRSSRRSAGGHGTRRRRYSGCPTRAPLSFVRCRSAVDLMFCQRAHDPSHAVARYGNRFHETQVFV